MKRIVISVIAFVGLFFAITLISNLPVRGDQDQEDRKFESEIRIGFEIAPVPLTERTLLGARTYYGLYIGLGLVFVTYGLTIRSIFSFLRRTKREPVYVWIAFLVWSPFICSILAAFAIEYDLLHHTPEPSIAHSRPLIDYLYYEIITFTTVGYGDIIPSTASLNPDHLTTVAEIKASLGRK